MYTEEDAKREVGNSTDWNVGLEASIKKWRQIVAGDLSYGLKVDCGICFVKDNRGGDYLDCSCCPARAICGIDCNAKTKLQLLIDLRKEVNQMDCSKTCANFKTRDKSPFPGTLRTADLEKGMLVANNRGGRYVILELLDDHWMRVFKFCKGYAYEYKESLGDNGCQPYLSGKWNAINWLIEVE